MKKTVSYLTLITFTLGLSLLTLTDAFSQSDSAPVHKAAYVSGLTPARVKSLIGVAFGLASVVIGWRIRSRQSTDPKRTKSWALAGMASGILAVVLSVMHLASNTGAFGTGGGKAGAIVALLLGVLGTVLNVAALRKQNAK